MFLSSFNIHSSGTPRLPEGNASASSSEVRGVFQALLHHLLRPTADGSVPADASSQPPMHPAEEEAPAAAPFAAPLPFVFAPRAMATLAPIANADTEAVTDPDAAAESAEVPAMLTGTPQAWPLATTETPATETPVAETGASRVAPETPSRTGTDNETSVAPTPAASAAKTAGATPVHAAELPPQPEATAAEPVSISDKPHPANEKPATTPDTPRTATATPLSPDPSPLTERPLSPEGSETATTKATMPATKVATPSVAPAMPSEKLAMASATGETPFVKTEMPSDTMEMPSDMIEMPSDMIEMPSDMVETPSVADEIPSAPDEIPSAKAEMASANAETPLPKEGQAEVEQVADPDDRAASHEQDIAGPEQSAARAEQSGGEDAGSEQPPSDDPFASVLPGMEASEVGEPIALDEADPLAERTLDVAEPSSAPGTQPTESRTPGRVDSLAALRTQPAAWLRDVIARPERSFLTADGWQVLEVALEDTEGTLTVQARREEHQVQVVVNFSDPELRTAAVAQAERLQEALRTHYSADVTLSFSSDQPGRDARQQSPQARASMPTPSHGSAASGQEGTAPEPGRAPREGRWSGGHKEWIG